jgi:hypothetical protein
MGIFTKLDGSSWQDAAVEALVFGIVSGVIVGFSTDKRRREERAIAGNLPKGQLRLARRAAQTGPIPDDPETRAAAQRIAGGQLELDRRFSRFFVAGATLALIWALALGMSQSPWNFLYVPAPALVLVSRWYWPRRVQRRIDALSAAADE